MTNTTTPDPAATAAAVARIAGLTPDEQAAVERVICTRGKNRGRLLRSCPPGWGDKADPLAAGAWTGLQPNHYRIGAFRLVLLPREAQALAVKLATYQWPSWLDASRAKLEAAGVW